MDGKAPSPASHYAIAPFMGTPAFLPHVAPVAGTTGPAKLPIGGGGGGGGSGGGGGDGIIHNQKENLA